MKLTDEQRFWSKVAQRGPDECWPWCGTIKWKQDTGRGHIWFGGKVQQAPAIALLLDGQEKPSEGVIYACHRCDNPNCVNPNHLWWGTPLQNAMDASRKGRLNGQWKTHCRDGHPLSGSNLMFSSGRRKCKTCQRENERNYRKRKRAPTKDAPKEGE